MVSALAGTLVLIAALAAWIVLVGTETPAKRPRTRVATRSIAARADPWGSALHATATPGIFLAGTVHDPAGAPIDRAEVCASRSTLGMEAPLQQCVAADSEGRYRFEALAAGAYVVSASAPGFEPGLAHDGEPFPLDPGIKTAGVDIVLAEGGARLAGHVHDALGGPVVGALVRSQTDRLHPLSAQAISDDEGAFELWVPGGAVSLTAKAEGYVLARQWVTAPSTQADLVLTPESRISGHVLSANDHEPVAGAEVRAMPMHRPMQPKAPRARSGEDGAFTLTGVEPGAYRILARGGPWHGTSPSPIEVDLASLEEGIVVLVERGAIVTGEVVLDESEAPCTRGRVALLGTPDPTLPLPEGASSVEEATTRVAPQIASIRQDGTVRFEGLRAGRYHAHVQCVDHNYAAGPRVVEVTDTDVEGVRWKVEPAITLVVHVEDARSEPVEGARLFVDLPAPEEGRAQGRMPLVTDASGTARAGNMGAGEYRISMQGSPHVKPQVLHARRGQREAIATLTLPGAGEITAHVEDASGQPVDNLTVRATRMQEAAQTSSASVRPVLLRALGEGTYAAVALADGQYRVEATDGVNPPASASVQVAHGREALVTLRLSRPGSVTGTVVDEQDAPVANAWVSARATGVQDRTARAMGAAGRVLTAPDGTFELDGLSEDATFALTASQGFGNEARATDVSVGDDVRITLASAAEVSGFVLNEDGAPVVGAFVKVSPENGSQHASTTSGPPDGRFHVHGVAPGRVRIRVIAAGSKSPETTAQLAPGERLRGLQLTLLPRDEELTQAAPHTP